MEKKMLKCDICGGTLKMQSNREAICENCGMTYSIESLRDKFNGLKVSVTGSNEDVAQWRVLLQTYLENCDYSAAESVVRKILEAIPNDRSALETYNNLQEWKYFDVRNGVLVGYSGAAKELIIPVGVKEIQRKLFCNMSPGFCSIVFPDGCKIIGAYAFNGVSTITEITLPPDLRIESCAFAATRIQKVEIPEGATVESSAFVGCELKSVVIHERATIEPAAFAHCRELKTVILHEENSKVTLSEEAFTGCHSLEKITTTSSDYDDEGRCVVIHPKGDIYEGQTYTYTVTRQILSPDGIRRESEARYKREEAFEQRRKQWRDWRDKGLCVYCGGEFTGILKKHCARCGKPKSY